MAPSRVLSGNHLSGNQWTTDYLRLGIGGSSLRIRLGFQTGGNHNGNENRVDVAVLADAPFGVAVLISFVKTFRNQVAR